MPVVPTPQRRVQPAGLPAPRLTSDVPQAAVGVPSGGLDLSAVRDQAIRIGQEEKQRADQVMLTEAAGRLTAGKTRIGAQAVSQQGKNAFGVPVAAEEEYNKLAQDIQDSLGSDEQRVAFKRMRASGWNELNNQIQYHVAAQRQQYDEDSTKAFLTAQQNDAILNANNPEIVESNIAAQKVALHYFGQRRGWDETRTENAQKGAVSSTRIGVLESMVNTGQDLTAEAYFKAHEPEFVGKDHERGQTLWQEGATIAQAQRQADAILATAKTGPDAMTAAQALPPGKVREEVERRIRRHYDDQATFTRRAQDEAYEEGGRILERTHDYDAIPLTTRLRMDESHRNQLRAAEKRFRNPERETRLDLWHHLNNLAHLNAATKQEFLGINLGEEKYKNGLSTTDWKHFDNLQTVMRGGGGTPGAVDRSLLRREESDIIKQAEENVKRTDAIKGIVSRNPKVDTSIFPQPKAIDIPQWMRDSALKSPDYARYLRRQGVPIPDALFTPLPDSAMERLNRDQRSDVRPVPGSPIVRPKTKAEMLSDALSEEGLAAATSRVKARAKP